MWVAVTVAPTIEGVAGAPPAAGQVRGHHRLAVSGQQGVPAAEQHREQQREGADQRGHAPIPDQVLEPAVQGREGDAERVAVARS